MKDIKNAISVEDICVLVMFTGLMIIGFILFS